ncbi:xylan 1,4-beta-xylosidase [Tengunoibacter tsumagoiensis]|uniref:Glycoside hydrolase family 42 N-terminal domain-containing protein n=1 Tax=Tengunoibacter tsumagoiensis TaxID=2014871 RepID=A0A402A0M2_9CHLR|nr:xylan 1,4-beta-xylosidase [Tengunoibacter tsumagoiensis]GCE12663.1 hypothetical protein KTT_25220 [Tengunoibacter tsumagoiensis]
MRVSEVGRRLMRCLIVLGPFVLLFWRGELIVPQGSHSQAVSVTVSSVLLDRVSTFSLGATHTQNDVDNGDDSLHIQAVEQLLQQTLIYQNQHIMGWGVEDPEPARGVYNWQSLDERVALMRRTHAQMILTLCCAPGWMRTPDHRNEWDDLEEAPAPQHIVDFAALAQTIALRYPDVHYFQVWNELKGMWSDATGATAGLEDLNRWDYERYTVLYNAVYDAIKEVRPDALIGGPYVVMGSNGDASTLSEAGPTYAWGTLDQRPLDVITYWLAHKHGADFITLDGSMVNDDGIWLTDPFEAARKFVDIDNWVRQQPHGGATLPIWWAEWYVGVPSSHAKNLTYLTAVMTAAQIFTLESQAQVVLTWEPQGDAQGYSSPEGLWTDPRAPAGGKATPYAAIAQTFSTYFKPGTRIYRATSTSSTVIVLASQLKTILVNRLPLAQEVIVDRTVYTLRPYQVLVVDTY